MPGKCGGFPTRKPRNHPPHTPLPLPCPIQCPLFFGKSTSSAPSISRVRRLSCSSNRFPIQRKSFTAAAFSFVFLNHRPPPAPQLGPRDVFTPCCTPLPNHAFRPLRCSQPACRTRQSSRRHRATAIKMAARSDAPDICTQYARYLEVEAAVWCLCAFSIACYVPVPHCCHSPGGGGSACRMCCRNQPHRLHERRQCYLAVDVWLYV